MIKSYKINNKIIAKSSEEYINIVFTIIEKLSYIKVSNGMYLLFDNDYNLKEISLETEKYNPSKNNMYEICQRCEISKAKNLVFVPSSIIEDYSQIEKSIKACVSDFEISLNDIIVVTEKGKPENKLKAYSTFTNDFSILNINDSNFISMVENINISSINVYEKEKYLKKEKIELKNIESNLNKANVNISPKINDISYKINSFKNKVKVMLTSKNKTKKSSLKEIYRTSPNTIIEAYCPAENCYIINKFKANKNIHERVGYILRNNKILLEIIVTGYDSTAPIDKSIGLVLNRAKAIKANSIVAFYERDNAIEPTEDDWKKFSQIRSYFNDNNIKVYDLLIYSEKNNLCFYSLDLNEYVTDFKFSNYYIQFECRDYQMNTIKNLGNIKSKWGIYDKIEKETESPILYNQNATYYKTIASEN